MIRLRPANQRGHANYGWLDTYHTFSFNDYHDPQHMRFRSLRVLNEDVIAPGQGFGMHPHRDMEIVTYVLAGELEHRDSLGHGEVLRAGELQRMTAGRGITHSEFNPSASEPVHLVQIWIMPEQKGLEPSYEQRRFPAMQRRNRLQLVASPDAADGVLHIRQDARLWLGDLEQGQPLAHSLSPDRHAWLQMLRGTIAVNGHELAAGDGAAVSDEAALEITCRSDAEFLLFDLA